MGEIKDFIQLYIEDSDLIPKQLGRISMDLEKNIKDELEPGHGFLNGELFKSIQAYVSYEGGADEISIITGESNTFYDQWVNDGHTLRNGEWWEGYHFMEAGLDKTVAMYK